MTVTSVKKYQTQQSFESDPSAYLGKPEPGLRERLFVIIFEADTRAGKVFDFGLIAAILISVFVVMLDSIQAISERHGLALHRIELIFTIAFTLEYIARLSCVRHPIRYATSFFGVIDLLSIIPTYAALFIPELHSLIDLRLLRLLRMFRLLKLTQYVEEYTMLVQALVASRRKIFIFLSVVVIIVIFNGTLLYVIEGGPGTNFSSIPTSVYWAITTVTTVGYGDVAPISSAGRAVASFTMLIGWSILAVPTGIITTEMTVQRVGNRLTTRTCPECLTSGLDADANYCKRCGTGLPPYQQE
ncbi:ion transporter [Herbaspirillum sp. GCM10030257]|uniref:ion transporter n=1 Tax=Herbaspirillum sp. GCM10030257 TaxID=3273393 RepID=UPI0036179525